MNYLKGALIAWSLALCIGCAERNTKEETLSHTDTTLSAPPRSLDGLRQAIASYIAKQPADIGVAIHAIENGDTLSVNGDRRYPLMSVAKFPQALALLRLIDQGKIAMTEPVSLTAADLTQRTASTLRKDHPGNSIELSIPEALRYMVGQSDNISSNKVFEMEGGPQAVTEYLRSIGVQGATLGATYRDADQMINQNQATPKAMTLLLKKFFADSLLSDSSKALLWKLMAESIPGADRIKGQLPAGTTVAHKTGTSGTDATGAWIATNDIGIVQMPNNKHLAISVFVANSKSSSTENAAIIATISKMVWDHFVTARP